MSQFQPPAAPRPAPSRGVWIASLLMAWAVGIAVGVGVAFGAGAEESAADAAESTTAPATKAAKRTTTTRTTTTTTTTQPPAPPEAGDFAIGITVLEKECFGSAGCLVTFRIKPTYKGTSVLDDTTTYTVVYEIAGGDEPQVNRFTITGDTASFPAEEMIRTPSSSAKLVAKATSVLEG